MAHHGSGAAASGLARHAQREQYRPEPHRTGLEYLCLHQRCPHLHLSQGGAGHRSGRLRHGVAVVDGLRAHRLRAGHGHHFRRRQPGRQRQPPQPRPRPNVLLSHLRRVSVAGGRRQSGFGRGLRGVSGPLGAAQERGRGNHQRHHRPDYRALDPTPQRDGRGVRRHAQLRAVAGRGPGPHHFRAGADVCFAQRHFVCRYQPQHLRQAVCLPPGFRAHLRQRAKPRNRNRLAGQQRTHHRGAQQPGHVLYRELGLSRALGQHGAARAHLPPVRHARKRVCAGGHRSHGRQRRHLY